jgi:tetratricopeptide (TPR) repeat protein
MSTPPPPNSLDALRTKARELHVAGRLMEAIQLQIQVVNTQAAAGPVPADDYHRLGIMLFAAKDFQAAAQAFGMTYQRQPDFPDVAANLGLCLILTERPKEAIPHLLKAHEQRPESLDVIDGLAHAYGKLGDLENARRYGEESLRVKDSRSRPPPEGWQPPRGPAPPLRLDRPQENVIAFSLFGNHERYTRGAVKNAVIAGGLYPGWRCRFYCDDLVPGSVRAALTDAGADVRMMPRPARSADGLFWRFLVLDDPAVVRFLIRDCDSILNIRERRAVDEWLASGKLYHILRDNAAHTDLILAGLWGGVARLLPQVAQLAQGFGYNPVTESRTADQLFLGRVVWPLVKHDCLIHDSVYRVFDARPFPAGADLPPGRHVGDNDWAFQSDGLTPRGP